MCLKKDKKTGKNVDLAVSADEKIKQLTAMMKEASDNLDFEMAAVYRDEIIKLKAET